MISVYPVQFPPSNTPITDASGNMSNSGMAFFRALYNRTGQGNGLANQVNAGALAGTTFDSDWNLVTGGTGDCILPALTGGQLIVVQNDTLLGVNVDAPSGATIDSAGSYTLASGKMQIFWYFSSTVIKSTQLG